MRSFDPDEAYRRMMLDGTTRMAEPTRMAETDPRFWNGVVFVLGFLFALAVVGLPALLLWAL